MNSSLPQLSPEGPSHLRRRVRLVFHSISGLFGLAYGMYTFYMMIFLNNALNRAKASSGEAVFNPLDSLLLVLAFTMLFEFFAEPMTGKFADVYGRKVAVIVAFLLVAMAFGIYATIGLVETPVLIITLAILAEFVIAVGLAFHSGSLDAWFVDAIKRYEENGTEVFLERDFGINMQCFTVGSAAGGSFGLFVAQHQFLWPWFLASSLMMLLAVASAILLSEGSMAARRVHETQEKRTSVLGLIRLLWGNRDVRRLLCLMSATYVTQIAFMYFVPLYIEVAAKDRGITEIPKYMFVVPLVLLVPRFLGPSFSRWLGSRVGKIATRLMALGLGTSVFLLLGSLAPFLPDSFGLYLTAGCLLCSWFCWHAARPVQVGLLNALIRSGEHRAFANSMSIPIGAAVVILISLTLVGIQLLIDKEIAKSWVSIAYLFGFVAVVSGLATVVTARQPSAPSPGDALDETSR